MKLSLKKTTNNKKPGIILKGSSIVVLIFISLLFGRTSIAQTCDFSKIISRVQEDQRSGIKYTGTMDNWVANQNSDGSWDDVTYGDLPESVGDKMGDHVGRLWHIAAAVSEPTHARYNNSDYKQAVKTGLDFWYQSDTKDPNWWYNQINFPQRLGEILIFMREFENFIPVADEQKIISLFSPQSIEDITSRSTGANAIDIGQHYIYRGVLTENCDLLTATRDRLEEILVVNIKNDLVYQDHGPQIQISSYGEAFCLGLLRLATYLADTQAAFDVNSENFGKVIRFIRETQISSVRGNCWDFSVMGRAVTRSGALNGRIGYLQKIIDFNLDPEYTSVYQDAVERQNGDQPPNYNVREFNKHYWVSDYTQHTRSGYLFTVRNVSKRTAEAETGNGENLKANYFSYGATFISVDGTEYMNIMPYWDWSMIPGTTFPYITTFPKRSNWGSNYGNTSFVGGVSDGMHGAAVLNLNEGTIQARKGWFFFEDEIVCLGAGITDNSGKNVRTTINQCKLGKPSYYAETGSSTEEIQRNSPDVYTNSNLNYIRNGQFAYYFPKQGNVKYTMKVQSGKWYDINHFGSTQTSSGNVFTLWFDHGENPQKAEYSYVVVPGIDSKEKAQAYDLSAIEIVENSADIQAVYHKTLDILEVIFYKPQTFNYKNRSITVNQSCALMLKNGTKVSVSDPAQANSDVKVTIEVNETVYEKSISLPTDNEMRGASVTIDFEIPTGTSFIQKEEDLQILCYPNSTSGLVNISTNSQTYLNCEIRNIEGNKLLDKDFKSHTTVDLSDFTSGTYIVSVFDGKDRSSQKILKY